MGFVGVLGSDFINLLFVHHLFSSFRSVIRGEVLSDHLHIGDRWPEVVRTGPEVVQFAKGL
jgi:hypothetical protein